MFRLRGSHCLPRTARHPELSNYLGVGKGKTAPPQSFCFCQRKEQKNEKGWRINLHRIELIERILVTLVFAAPNIR